MAERLIHRVTGAASVDMSMSNAPALYPAIAFAAGIAMALLIFPSGLLFGSASYWDHIQGDNAANWIGYEAFARDAWRLPLFNTKLLSPPAGVNILFTDPIPLLALLGKLIFKLTGVLPNYFGLWLLFAYGLQPLVGYALLRALRLSRPAALAGGLLFLTVPAFIFRYGHFPLLSHWVLLLALLFHVLIVRDGRLRDVALAVAFVVALVLVNPYLLVMTAGIVFAALGDAAIRRRITPLSAGLALLTMMAGVAALAVGCGFIDPGRPPPPAGGFGLYSMNLLSPVIPQLSAWPGAAHFIVSGTPGQYEGYNYLGLGLLALLALAAFVAWRPLRAFVRGRPLLFLVAAGLAVYSLSTTVYAGNHLILELPFERFRPFALFAGVFRSSGRFFWPMAYVLTAAACVALFARLGTRRFVLLAAALLLVQAVDISPLVASVAARAKLGDEILSRESWTKLARLHDEVLILPEFLCTTPANRGYAYELGLISARLGLPTNSAIINRSDLDCAAEKAAYRQSLGASATKPDPLVVVFKDEASPEVPRFAGPASGLQCRDAGFAFVCSKHADTPAMLAVSEPIGPALAATPGVMLPVWENGRGLQFLGPGWSDPGAWGVWGVGPAAYIRVPLASKICGDVLMRAKILPFGANGYLVDHAGLEMNGRKLFTQKLDIGGEQVLALRLPNTGCLEQIEVVLRFTGLRSPAQLGVGSDPRLLTWGLQLFSFAAAADE